MPLPVLLLALFMPLPVLLLALFMPLPLSLLLALFMPLPFTITIAIVVVGIIPAIGIVHTYIHSHFIAHIIEALGLTIHGNGSRDGDTIGIFLCLNRALVWCSTLEASAKWPFKGGLETLCHESEERIGRCRVR